MDISACFAAVSMCVTRGEFSTLTSAYEIVRVEI